MKKQFTVKRIPYEEMESILPLVFKLNKGKITSEVLQERLQNMLDMGGYDCIGVFHEEQLIGVCGFWILNKLYVGKHVEPDNVYVEEAYRSDGVGQLMIDWLFDYAKEIGCKGTEVNCYLANPKGQKFWERQGYEPLAYHYFKNFE